MARTRLVLLDVAVAASATAVATVVQELVWTRLPHPHLLFYPAVFLASRTRGLVAGLVCTVLSTFAIAYFFLEPTHVLHVQSLNDAIDLGLFAAISSGIAVTLHQLRSALARSRAAEAEAKRAKDATEAVWSMIAHDLRTPLSVITLSSGELSRLERPQLERSVEVIRRSADRATDLLHDALVAMRLSGGALPVDARACNLRELCATAIDAVRPLAQRRGVILDLDVPPDLTVRADDRRIVQVLTNLIVNATKVSASGAHVSLHAEPEGDARAAITVEDHGPGIPPSRLEAIFTKYWSEGAEAGTGLGLWIARAIVEAHGGTLDVASEVGAGTRFTFHLARVDHARSITPGVDPVDHA